MTREKVIEIIQDYAYNNNRLLEIQERIDSICPKTTATYGNLAPSSGGGFSSKVENVGDRRVELERSAVEYKRKVAEIKRLINRSGLTEQEKALMWWIANNGKLQAYARRERIGKDNVYKIRDRAVDKIIKTHYKPHNV